MQNLFNNTMRILFICCGLIGMAFAMGCTVYAAGEVSYIDAYWDADKGEVVTEEKKVSEYTELQSGETENLEDGWYVVKGNVVSEKRIYTEGAVNIILCDGASLTAASGLDTAGAVLNIYGQKSGTGKLIATGETYGAGIGGNTPGSFGNITINGGNIIAVGGAGSAGIGGGGDSGTDGSVTINGGNVTAKAGSAGAGIGSGESGNDVTVTINGGTITAEGVNDGAGIGDGHSSTGASVKINGGNVTAKGGTWAGGIGSCGFGNNVTVTITGGVVYAEGGEEGAGIGGTDSSIGLEVNISGGFVAATGNNCAGISGGNDEKENSVKITGGTVMANGANEKPGIGSKSRDNIIGKLTVKDGMLVYGGMEELPSDLLAEENGDYERFRYMIIKEGHNFGYALDGTKLIAVCQDASCGLKENKIESPFKAPERTVYGDTEKSEEAVLKDLEAFKGIVHPDKITVTITYEGREGTEYEESETAPVDPGLYTAAAVISIKDPDGTLKYENEISTDYEIVKADPAIPQDLYITCGNALETVTLPEGWAWEDSSEVIDQTGESLHHAIYTPVDPDRYNTYEADLTVTAIDGEPVEYLIPVWSDDEEQLVTYEEGSVLNYTEITEGTSSWEDGWYVLKNDVTFSERIEVSGDVHLLLCDRAVLNAENGIHVPESAALTIHGQKENTGKLNAKGFDSDAGIGGDDSETSGEITINGGIITAENNGHAAGIGGGSYAPSGTVRINGGVITATGGDGSAGIGSGEGHYDSAGSVYIRGGVIFASGGEGGYSFDAGANGFGESEFTIPEIIAAYGGNDPYPTGEVYTESSYERHRYMVLNERHKFEHSISESGDTLIAECKSERCVKKEQCYLPDHKTELTISAPERKVAADKGSSPEATLSPVEFFSAHHYPVNVEIGDIHYTGREETVYDSTEAPEEAGSYTASVTITVDSQEWTISTDYKIQGNASVYPPVKGPAKEDIAAAEAVTKKIDALPSKITLKSKSKVNAAEKAYKNLTDTQKSLVSEKSLTKLFNAQKAVAKKETTKITKAKVKKKGKVLVKWKKVKGKSYVLKYSKNKKFKKNVKTLKIKAGKTSKVVKKLKKKKMYYFKVRTCSEVTNYITGETVYVYGKWSKTASARD